MNGGWQESALCAQIGPDLWFPDRGGSVRLAKTYCRRCPVLGECLDWALAGGSSWNGIDSGVWGGTTANERRDIRRRMRKAAA